MEFLFPIVLSIHILVGLGVIGLVLLQHGKGADMGAAFGSGASGSLFGASGSANFLSRATAILAAVFFVTSLGLSYLSNKRPAAPDSVMQTLPVPAPAGGAATVPLPSGDTPTEKPAASVEKETSQSTNDGLPKSEAGAVKKEETGAGETKATPGGSSAPKSAAGKGEATATEKPAKTETAADKKTVSEAAPADSKAKEIPK